MPGQGSCLCGGITYQISSDVTETGACHCGMCRKWSGGIYLGVEVKADAMHISGADLLTTYASSEWAERSFCSRCGSSMWYRVTAPGPHQGTYHVGRGTLEQPEVVALTGEIWIDRKPDGYSFAEKTYQMTGAELMEMIASGS